MTRVIVTVAPDGKTTFRVEGVAGPGCTDLTRALQQALGRTVSDVKTSDYYAAPQQVNSARRRVTT